MARSSFRTRFPQRKTTATTLLAANVRRFRLARGLSQTDLAGELGIEQQVISLIENGRANPTLLIIDALARTLEVQVLELFEAKAEPVLKPS